MKMSWVLGSGRALAVRVDEPGAGGACGAVVLVPSLGRESVVAFRTMRALAVACAARGFVAFSPDLSGNGDSESLREEDAGSAWKADVAAVVAAARSQVGDLPVHVVGLRVGGTLVDGMDRRAGEVRVAWEPISGKAFLRRAQAIRRLTMPQKVVEGGIEIPGAFFSRQQADSVSTLSAPDAKSGVALVWETDRATADRMASVSPHHARIPLESVRALVESLPGSEAIRLESLRAVKTATMTSLGGMSITETHVRVGPHALPGVLTEPVAIGAGADAQRAVMFTAMGAELKAGPGNLWATVARELAARGTTCLRVDRRLLGDALDTTMVAEPRPYTNECIEDVGAGVAWLRERTALPVMGVGVCSGAWSFLRAAHAIEIDEVVAVNNIDWDPDPQSYDEAFYEQAFRFDSAMNDSTVESAAEEAHGGRMKAEIVRRYRGIRHRLGVRFPGARARLRRERVGTPVSALLDPVPMETRLRLIMGLKEVSRFRYLRGEFVVSRARRRGKQVLVTVDESLDHSLLSEAARRALLGELLDAASST